MSPRLRESAVALAQTAAPAGLEPANLIGEFGRFAVIGAMAFLTLVDLFATQAILPSLAAHYGTSPAQTGIAVNATTLGMAIASLGIALFARRIDR
jgi:predicted MFS family arabinose efflux permease